VVQAFFSILEPGKVVPAHNGPFFGFLRYHLGMVVPTDKPPSIRVRDQVYTWKERESVMFDDSWNHEVMNESEQYRVVLCVDVLRPMPWPLSALNRFWFRYKVWVGAYPELERLRLHAGDAEGAAAGAGAPAG
jgi:aspartyl/asparaginyl beta-hydroxylase (cupin superfamily)